MVALHDSQCGLYMAQTAELYAEQQGITRDKMDEFALRSQCLAGEAQKACRLSEEITPVALEIKRVSRQEKYSIRTIIYDPRRRSNSYKNCDQPSAKMEWSRRAMPAGSWMEPRPWCVMSGQKMPRNVAPDHSAGSFRGELPVSILESWDRVRYRQHDWH